MSWLPLPPGTDVGDLPAAPTPVAGVVTVAAVVVPWATRELYALTARRGSLAVTGAAAVTKEGLEYGIAAGRGQLQMSGKVAATRKTSNHQLTADGGGYTLTGNDAAMG